MSRATRVTGTGAATSGRTYLQSVHLTTSGAGRLTLTDGDGGDTKFDIDTSGSETASFPLSEEGVYFDNGVHAATATNVSAATLVFR